MVPGRLPPMVVPGWPRSLLLLPTGIIEELGASQRAALILHELVHIRRRDHWVRMLEWIVGVVYWWLPIIGSIRRQLRDCEETCCDAAVVAHLPESRREYARLLLDVLDFADPLPEEAVPQATAMSAVEGLERRLLAILDVTERTRRTWPAGVFALALAFAVLPCGLQYDFSTRPAAITESPEPEPAAIPLPLNFGCCPS